MAAAAAQKLLTDFLSSAPEKSVLVRALSVPGSQTVRSVALKVRPATCAAWR